MPSPFPGMDPYLEQAAIWLDFHDRFINCWSEAIPEKLPPRYDVRIAERVYLTDPDEGERRTVPDVSVGRDAEASVVASSGPAAFSVSASVLEPVTVPLPQLDPIIERLIEVVTLPDREIVCVLELLSPTNKSGRGRVEYLDKRDEFIKTSVHLVELDLLCGGHRLPMRAPLPKGDYYAFVSRGDRRPYSHVYAWDIKDRLPLIPIPLRTPDPDVMVDLAAVFGVAYERGRYPRAVKYDRDPIVPFTPSQLDWVRTLTRSQLQ